MPARKRIDDSGFADHITDLLAPWGVDLAIKRMFGGSGVFADGKMIAIIIDDILYFKDVKDADGNPVQKPFTKRYFEYDRKGKMVQLGYYQAPPQALEDSRYAIELARESYMAASLGPRKSKKPSR